MKKTLIIVVFALCVVPAPAQLARWTEGSGHVDLGKMVSVWVDPQGGLVIDSVSAAAAASRFTLSQQSILHFGFSNAIVWLRFSLDNPTHDSLLLELNHAFIPTADLYYKDASGQWIVQRGGFQVPLDKKPVTSDAQVFTLPAGRHEFFLRMQPYVHAIPVTLWEQKSYSIKAGRENLIHGIYVGLLLFAISINLFLFYTFRKSYYLNYSVLVLLYILSSALVMEGYAVYFFPSIDLMFWYRLVPVLDMPALIFYCLAFLEVKRWAPRLYRLCWAFCLLLLAYSVTLEFLPLMPVLIANQLLALLTFILAIGMGMRVGKKGNKLGYYFVVAYSIWFVLINMELVYIQTGQPRHLGEISYVSLAIFIEAFLLAYLLIQRFRWEKQESQRMQILMQAHINKMHREFQHAIFSSKLEIQEHTFQEISQEIHDNIGQILSLAKLHIATMDGGGNPVLDNKIRDSKSLVTKAIADLRNLSHRLNTGYIAEVGFDTAVKREMDTIQRSGAYDTKFSIGGKAVRFDAQKELILFRIVQELLNNILKHAKAKSILVELDYTPRTLLVTVQDDGVGFHAGSLGLSRNGNGHDHSADFGLSNSRDHNADPGFDPEEEPATHGLGLKSMHHRAGLIEAEFRLNSTIGAGTTATIHLPLNIKTETTASQPAKNSTL